MDVLLETNLNDAVSNDIGFMTPIDEVSWHVQNIHNKFRFGLSNNSQLIL